jgi:hypothetical protein
VCLTSAMTNSGRVALTLGRMDDLRRSLPKECHGRNVIDNVCLPYLSALALPNKHSSPVVYRMSSFVLIYAVLYKEGKGIRRSLGSAPRRI